MSYGVRIEDLGDRDSWTCWVCGGTFDAASPSGSPHRPSVDHVVPRARGGTNDPANVRLAHRLCNGQRGSRLPELDWPDDLGVHEPAPLWPVLQRALRRRGDWETRLQPLGPSLATLALRTAPEPIAPRQSRRSKRRR